MNESIVADSELRFYRLIPPSMFSIPISPKKSPAPICFSTSPESLHIDEFAFVVEKYRSRQSFVPASQIYHNNKKKCGRRVRPTRYAPPACNDTGTALGQDGSDWSRTLRPWPLTWEVTHGACGWCRSSPSIRIPSLKFVGLAVRKIWRTMCMSINGSGDLDLWTFDLETGMRVAWKVRTFLPIWAR